MPAKKERPELRSVGVRIPIELYNIIENKALSENKNNSEVIRELISLGLERQLDDTQIDKVSKIIREQLEIVLRQPVERLAALNAKTGVMAAAAAYLNAQALMDFVPDTRRKDAYNAFTKAKAKGALYMQVKLDDDFIKNTMFVDDPGSLPDE